MEFASDGAGFGPVGAAEAKQLVDERHQLDLDRSVSVGQILGSLERQARKADASPTAIVQFAAALADVLPESADRAGQEFERALSKLEALPDLALAVERAAAAAAQEASAARVRDEAERSEADQALADRLQALERLLEEQSAPAADRADGRLERRSSGRLLSAPLDSPSWGHSPSLLSLPEAVGELQPRSPSHGSMGGAFGLFHEPEPVAALDMACFVTCMAADFFAGAGRQPDRAEALYQSVRRHCRPGCSMQSHAAGQLAVLLHGSKRAPPDEVEAAYREAIAIAGALEGGGGAPSLHAKLGNLLKACGREAEAEAEYRRALALDGANAEALGNLAVLSHGKGADRRETLRLYEAALAANPYSSATLSNFGLFLLAEYQDHRRALQLYERAVQIDPTNANACFNLGSLNDEVLQRTERARFLYERALEIDPKHEQSREALRRMNLRD